MSEDDDDYFSFNRWSEIHQGKKKRKAKKYVPNKKVYPPWTLDREAKFYD